MTLARDPKQGLVRKACFGILAVESWLWNPSYGILAVESLLRNHGCGIMALESWLWSPGHGILAVESWLWEPGCGILAVASWLWNPGCGGIWETPGRALGGTWEVQATWEASGGKVCSNHCK